MKLSRALLLSLAVTVAATVLLSLLFGGRAYALFLLLPLGFLFRRKPADVPPGETSRNPIEPS